MSAGRCDRCGREGPTREVRLHQHVGLVVVFWHRRVRGALCRACVRSAFGEVMTITLLGGWWGFVSFFATLFFLSYDVVHYLLTARSFAEERDTGARGRVAIAVIAGAAPLALGCLALPWILVRLLAGALASTGGHATGYATAAADAPASVCAGSPLADALAVDPARPEIAGRIARSGGWEPEPRIVPDELRAAGVPSVVACLDAEIEEIVERCGREGPGGPVEVRRVEYPRVLRLLVARSGAEIARATIRGSDAPGPCPPADELPEGLAVVRVSGARVQPGDVAQRIPGMLGSR